MNDAEFRVNHDDWAVQTIERRHPEHGWLPVMDRTDVPDDALWDLIVSAVDAQSRT